MVWFGPLSLPICGGFLVDEVAKSNEAEVQGSNLSSGSSYSDQGVGTLCGDRTVRMKLNNRNF